MIETYMKLIRQNACHNEIPREYQVMSFHIAY